MVPCCWWLYRALGTYPEDSGNLECNTKTDSSSWIRYYSDIMHWYYVVNMQPHSLTGILAGFCGITTLLDEVFVKCMAVCTAFSTPILQKNLRNQWVYYINAYLGPSSQRKLVHAIEFLCYDDGCHLRNLLNNPVSSTLTDTTKRIAAMETVIDKIYFKEHIDLWCRHYCSPNDFDELKKVHVHM